MPTYWLANTEKANLKHWLEPQLAEVDSNQLVVNNFAVGALRDMMGVGDYAQATAGQKPLYKTNQRFGRGCLDFDGVDDCLTGVDLDNILTNNGTGTIILTFAPDDHTTQQDIFGDTGGKVVIRIDGGVVQARNTDSGGVTSIGRTLSGPVSQWHTFAWRHGGGSVHATLDDPDNTASLASGNTVALTAAIIGAGTAVGARAFNGRFGALAAWDKYVIGDEFYKLFFHFLSRWGDRGDPLEQARERASRFLQLRGRPRNFVEIRTNLRALDLASAADVGIAHPRGPHPAGLGWARTDRRPTRKLFSSFDPASLTIDLKLADALDVAHTYRETGTADRSSDPRREGVSLSGVGSGYEFFRIGKAWVRDPSDLRVVELQPGTIKVERTPIHWGGDPTVIVGGILAEHFAVNHLPRSSFVNGFTGITQVPGTGGTIALDSTLPLLFDTAVTPQAGKLTSGTTDCYLQWTTASIAANTHLCFSTDIRCDSGHALSFQIVRNVDGFFWNDSTQAWQAGNVWNAMTVSGTGPLAILRGRSLDIALGGSASTVTCRVGFPGSTAGRVGHVYHVQLEEPGGFPTSRIVTTTALADRELELIARPNPSGRRGWPNLEGSLFLKYTPLFNRSDLEDAGGSSVFLPHILQVHHSVFGTSSGHGWTLEYEPSAGASGQLQFFGSNAGQGSGPPRATFDVALVAGQPYRIGCKWIGGVVSIFVAGVKGTDATINGTPTETDDSMIYVGGRNACDGYIEDIEVKPRALHDEAMKVWRT